MWFCAWHPGRHQLVQKCFSHFRLLQTGYCACLLGECLAPARTAIHIFSCLLNRIILWHFEPGDTEIVRFPWIQMTKNNYKWHFLIPSYDKWPINLINRFNRLYFQEWHSWSLTWSAFSSPAFPFSSLSSLLDNGPARDPSSFLEGNEKMSTLMVMRKMVMMMLGCPKGVQKDFGF